MVETLSVFHGLDHSYSLFDGQDYLYSPRSSLMEGELQSIQYMLHLPIFFHHGDSANRQTTIRVVRIRFLSNLCEEVLEPKDKSRSIHDRIQYM